jgi:hypothetical protein
LREARDTIEPYDGVTEMWLDDLESPSNKAAMEAGKRLLEDECTFIDLVNSCIFYAIEHEIF